MIILERRKIFLEGFHKWKKKSTHIQKFIILSSFKVTIFVINYFVDNDEKLPVIFETINHLEIDKGKKNQKVHKQICYCH